MGKQKFTDEQLCYCLKIGMKQSEIADKFDTKDATVSIRIKKLKEHGELPKFENNEEIKRKYEAKRKSYGQRQAEKLQDKTRINPNSCLQELLENEKMKTRQLLQKVQELEKENANLRARIEV